MKKVVYYFEGDDEELGQLDFRQKLFGDDYQALEADQNGFVKGKFRLQLTWCSEDDCDCAGFQHHPDCEHHEICF